MKRKIHKSMESLAKDLGCSEERGHLAVLKAKLTTEIVRSIAKQGLTHREVSELSGVPRTAVTGIVNHSLQKVTIDRLIRILVALGKSVDFKIKKAA